MLPIWCFKLAKLLLTAVQNGNDGLLYSFAVTAAPRFDPKKSEQGCQLKQKQENRENENSVQHVSRIFEPKIIFFPKPSLDESFTKFAVLV